MFKEDSMTAEDVFVLPASFAQQRLWLLDQLQPGDPTYNIAAAVRLKGQLEIDALRDGLNKVAQRHETLRTTFMIVDDELVQVVAQSLNVLLPVIDLHNLTKQEREAEFKCFADNEAQRPFDLARGPLLRCVLLKLDEQEHALLLVMHHIISDGWSIGVLIAELSALYKAYTSGQQALLPELPIQYADYAAWQRGWLQGEVLESQLDYWKERLAGAPGVLELPADYTRPPIQTFRSASITLELPVTLSQSLKALSRRNGVTLFMTLLAAFKVLLHRYTGQDDIVLGSPIAGRDRAEVKGLIGCFLNLMVLRTELSGNPSFDEVLERVRQTTVGAYTHQDLPFEKLLEELQPERDLSRAPLFQVFFNMLNLPEQEISLPGLSVEIVAPQDVGAKFDVTMYVRELQSHLVLELVFKADIFAHERMAEMLRQYEHLLSQVVVNTAKRIQDFSLVTVSAEKILPNPVQSLNNDWLGSVPERFSKQAQRAPERAAMTDKHETWSYGELRAHSNQLANYLCARGIRNEDVVAIYGHRSSALVWALLGVLKAGAAFTILDPAYPSARLIEYLKLAEPQGLINLAAAGPLPVELDEFVEGVSWRVKLELPPRGTAMRRDLFADYPTRDPKISIKPDDLAYISFTSGSTGKPKGVQGRHGPLTHFLPWLEQEFSLDENDRYTMLSALGHDPLHRDIFTPLQLGACICIPDQEDIEVAGRIAEWMKHERVTIAHLTPAMGQLLTETSSNSQPCQVTSLRYAFLVGDVLTQRDVARLRKLAPSITCINYYGSTETQRAVSYFRVANNGDASKINTAGTLERGKEILPLGKGIDDVQLILLNSAGRLAGIGEIGEINLRSPHVARGYIGDDALTQERFIENPFTKNHSDRFYRTGDLGRYLPDGNVEPLGRADHQVKIRGFRVELGELEAALGSHPGVRECAVIAREDEPGDKRLVSYYVAEEATAPTGGELRQFLKERLPDYMIPSTFVLMDHLPLTPNKKVDRRALPAPLQTEATENAGSSLPPTTVEQKVSDIWARVLKLERVGLSDNFFELGGHSLLAISLIARVREEFDIELPLREFFESPTVAQTASQVERLLESRPGSRVPAPTPVARTGELPLSFSQQRLWFVDQLEPGNPAYNIFAAIHLAGRLDTVSLEQGINEVLRRHEIMRTSFAAVDGQPVAVISNSANISLPIDDLRAIPEAERNDEVTRRAVAEAQRPFDLTRPPLLRASLLMLGEDEHVLLLTMHHIISDGWSTGVLLREMASLYEAFSNDQPSPLPALPIQYADFAQWQREWLQGDVLDAQMAFWRKQLANIPSSMALPTDYSRQNFQGYRGASQFRQFSDQTYEDLKTLSRKEGVTFFVTLLTAFNVLLHKYTRQNDLVVGSPVAGRNLIESEGLIGFFANTLLLRSDLSGNPTFRELLERVRELTLNAYMNQDLPFDKLVEELQPQRQANYMPLAQVQFSLQNATQVVEVHGLRMSRLTIDKGAAMFDLVLNMSETPGGLAGTMEYSTDLFDATTINRMLAGYEMLLDAVVARPDASLSELEGMLIKMDQQQIATEAKERQESLLWKLKHIERKSIAVSLPQ
jgi:amino acid adenylation domain-containing protein